jgi:biopolymer transport protein ExbD
MTPMVDVTFLLLIFFMVTAAFSLQKSLEIPKPEQDPSENVEQQEPEDDPSYVTVYVDENNTYRVVTVDWDEEAPSEQELLRKLREARNDNSSGKVPTKLLVKAHGDSLIEKVVSALDAGTEVGMEQVQLVKVEEIE